jgi:Phage capsid family
MRQDTRQGIPLRPVPELVARRNVAAVTRVIIARGVAKLAGRSDEATILRSRFPDDPVAPLILRGAVTPTSLANTSALGTSIVADIIATIGSVGAGARLLQAGLQLVFNAAASILVPTLEARADQAAFVGEGGPVPVHDLVTSAVTLDPHKVSTVAVLSEETIESSNAEALVTDALTRSVGLTLDAALFDAAAGDTNRPAGLRHNIPALTASTATDRTEAMIEDLSTLAGAVSVIGERILFIAAPARATAMQLRSRGPLPFPVLGSPVLAANDLIAIAAAGLASAVDTVPEIATSKHASMHMDTVPLPIVQPGTPVTVAAPQRSLFQTRTVGVKIRFDASWALRDPRALAWMSAVAW